MDTRVLPENIMQHFPGTLIMGKTKFNQNWPYVKIQKCRWTSQTQVGHGQNYYTGELINHTWLGNNAPFGLATLCTTHGHFTILIIHSNADLIKKDISKV